MPKAKTQPKRAIKVAKVKKAVKQPISTPNYCKVIKDKATGINVTVMAVPDIMVHVKKCPCSVAIGAIAGNVNYVESVKFKNLNRALDYIADYGTVQAKRFAEKTLEVNTRYPERQGLDHAAESKLTESK